MQKALLAIGIVLAVVIVAALNPRTQAWFISMNLPDFPDWPAPQRTLAASDEGRIFYATSSPYDLEVILNDMSLARPTTGLGYLSYPEKTRDEQPMPAMIIVPGSGGIAAGREDGYAQLLNARGVATFIVEYYEPRGFDQDSNYLIRTSSVTEFDLIADAYAALLLLGSSTRIDAERIGVMGFSYGGMAARLAIDPRIHQALAPQAQPFSLHIDNYGPCFQKLGSTGSSGAPLLTLRGTDDASNDLAACAQREDELRALGVAVTAKVYDGAGHAWENTAARHFAEDAPYLAGCELAYDPQGRALLNGEPLTDYALEASHAEKMVARFSSASRFGDCVGWGYYVGHDRATRDQGYADILDFLGEHWGIDRQQP